MARESRIAIYAGIAATIAIAATKFVAAHFSGSSAMLSEGMHSLVDTSDGLLLLWGQLRAARPPDELHPMGHGKEIYFWSLIVAILFFALGGGMSLYEGIQHILDPEPTRRLTWSYVVLAASAVFTVASFTTAFGPIRRRAAGRGYWFAFRRSKDPTLFTLALEDLADLAGLALAFLGIFFGSLLHEPVLDGVGSVGIGLVMAVVAVILAHESKQLLIGEGASPEALAAVRSGVAADPAVVAVRRPVTVYFGPATVLLAMDVEFRPELTTAEIVEAVDRLEAHIRRARPEIRFYIYIETESLKQAAGIPAPPAA